MKRQWWLWGIVLIAVAAGFLLGRANIPNPSVAASTVTGAVAQSNDKVVAKSTLPGGGKSPPTATSGTSLPPAGAPLRDTFAELQARAAAGDASAATRLSRDLGHCNSLRSTLWTNAGTADDLVNRPTAGMTEAQLRTYQMLLDSMEARQREAKKIKDLCEGVNEEMLATLVPVVAQAAQLGDIDARACYLSRGPALDMHTLLDHPEFLQNYRSASASLIDAGLAAGDWRVVDLLKSAYEPGAQSLLAGLLGVDATQHYRYLKLYRLGAESFRIPALDKQLAAAAANLTPAQIADSDAWAQSSFQQSFKGPSTAATQQGWDPCAFAGG